ncbi:MAG: ribonuclease HIII [Acidaminococcaceae bacterium]
MIDFSSYLENIRQQLCVLPDAIIKEKELPYGRQFQIVRGKEKVVLSVYKGKKGISSVWGGQEGMLMNSAMAALSDSNGNKCTETNVTNIELKNAISLLENCAGFKGIWVGSDESGKGDFFGPLVVAAVLVDTDIARELIAAGVKDCKVLTDKEIHRLAPIIKEVAPINVVLALKPEMYNYRYEQLRLEKKNLNHLLANGHVSAIRKAVQQRPECNYALVDQFSVHSGIREALEKEFADLIVVEQKRAEADIAVAAASVLARERFLMEMEELSVLAGRKLAKGGGEIATAQANEIKNEFGLKILEKLVKKHFSNYKKIN